MKQEQAKGSGTSTQSVEDQLRDKFQEVKETQTQEPDRKVVLRYKTCCGCGCNTYEIERTVPFGSPLKNGDRVDSMEKGDKQLREV